MDKSRHISINGIQSVVEYERMGAEWCFDTMLRTLKKELYGSSTVRPVQWFACARANQGNGWVENENDRVM